MKSIIKSLLIIVAVTAVAGGATYAYFFDEETSTGNTFTAGTLDLKVDGKDGSAIGHISEDNVVPAVQWHGEEYDHQFVLKNAGTVPGHVTYTIKNVKNWENGCNDPEAKANDITCGTGSDQGELGTQSQLKMTFQLNTPPYGYSQDVFPVTEGVSYTPGAYHLNPGETKNVYIRSWLISGPNNNIVQGDKLEFDIEFRLDQDV
jgi:predicted ribosomally synthesized peptide with SipW-like signal peptide